MDEHQNLSCLADRICELWSSIAKEHVFVYSHKDLQIIRDAQNTYLHM
jgi:hypothetical protein